MSKTGRRRMVALPSVPAAVAASTAIASRLAFHAPEMVIGMAALTGMLALFGVLLVSAEAQKTIRTWIRYRTEHSLGAAEAYERRQRIRTATQGLRWTASTAASIRQDARAFECPSTNLTDIMRINRRKNSTGPCHTQDHPNHSLPHRE